MDFWCHQKDGKPKKFRAGVKRNYHIQDGQDNFGLGMLHNTNGPALTVVCPDTFTKTWEVLDLTDDSLDNSDDPPLPFANYFLHGKQLTVAKYAATIKHMFT